MASVTRLIRSGKRVKLLQVALHLAQLYRGRKQSRHDRRMQLDPRAELRLYLAKMLLWESVEQSYLKAILIYVCLSP